MARFLLRRLVAYLVLIFIAASLAYGLAASTMNPRANFEGRNPPPPPAVVDSLLDDRNLNDHTPLVKRYAHWLEGVVTGDFGKTWEGDSVNEEMGRRIGVSARLLLIGTVLGSVLGVLVGAYSAVKQYKLTDRVITVLAFVILSIPVFVLANLLVLGATTVNEAVGEPILAVTGEYTAGFEGNWWEGFVDRLQHLVLPTLTIVLGQIAIYSRYQRNMMLDVLGSDFVRTAMAKGLRRRKALFKHALRTALIPAATYFSYNFGLLLTGATFTEKIFGWNGMGAWFIDSVNRNDVNSVAAFCCFAAVLVLLAGMLSDVLYSLLDPRVRVS